MVAFLSYIHKFNDITILFGVLFVSVAIVIMAPFIGRVLVRLPGSEERFTAALDGFKGITSILGILAAFSLVQANGNVRMAQEQVAKEAALTQTIDRVLLRSGQPDLAAIRPLVNAYLKARIEKEWPVLAEANRSPETDRAYSDLSKAIRGLPGEEAKQPAVYAELLKALDELSDMRELTISESDPAAFSLGSFYWVAILIFCGIAFILAVFTKPSLSAIATTAAATSAVALMLAMLMIVDLPFQGETSVSTDPLQRAMVVNARRT